ncbi:MAG: hypothetical protein AB7V40_06255 [Methyloceanibacter sp.]
MRSERRGEPHLHVTPAAESAVAANRLSLLRLSLGQRLLLVAAASALLWGAVLWALR